MKALTWHGKGDVRCKTVPDPSIQHPRDAIIKVVAACAICGSDVHDGIMPAMESGDVLGHETMSEVFEIGPGVNNLKVGESVVVPFTIACGECFFCRNGFYSGCERKNPDYAEVEKLWGPFAGPPIRLLASARRLCRRSGRIYARRSGQNSGRENAAGRGGFREGTMPKGPMFQFLTVVIPTCLPAQSMASLYTRAAERELLAEEGMRR